MIKPSKFKYALSDKKSSAVVLIALVIGVLYLYFEQNTAEKRGIETAKSAGGAEVYAAFQSKKSDVQVAGHGYVQRLLPDDLKGSRHQKFILQLPSNLTVLVAHNIDLAPRIDALRVGDQVFFFGEYEWNNKGGVIHWTHHDPNGRHVDGWLRHEGKLYQ